VPDFEPKKGIMSTPASKDSGNDKSKKGKRGKGNKKNKGGTDNLGNLGFPTDLSKLGY